jgi:tryptophan aminotransferase
MTATLDRKLGVLKLARQHSFIILEGVNFASNTVHFILPDGFPNLDDPYYYLYYGSAPRVSSYFALEAQTGEIGRVLRFDSFSKIISGGVRVGLATGPTPLLDVIDMHVHFSFCTHVRRWH